MTDVRFFEITTFEWAEEDVASDASESVEEAKRLTADLDVTFTFVMIGYESASEVWRVTGPDVDEAARRLDADVEKEKV